MGRFFCCWRTKVDDTEVAEEAEEAYAEELREIRCPTSLTPRSPCLTSLRSSPHPSCLRASPAAASYRTSPLSFRTSPTSTYLHIDNGTSPTSSRLMAQSPNPSNPCSSILHLSGLLDPSLTEEKAPGQEEEENPRTPLPHHTCSLCSLIRRHDQRSLALLSSGSPASKNQSTVGKGNFAAGLPCTDEEEEEGHCKCTEDDPSPHASPSSPLTVKAKPALAPYFPQCTEDNLPPCPPSSPNSPTIVEAKPVLAPYFPPSPVQEIEEGSSHLNADNQQSTASLAIVSETSDPVEDQFLTIKRTLDTLMLKRRSPSAMVRASHASLAFPERLI